MNRTRCTMAAGALLAVLMLTGCGGGGSASDSGASSARDVGTAAGLSADDKAAAESQSQTGSADGRSDAAAPLVTDQKVVKTAAMTVRAKNVNAAATATRNSVEQAKGFIADEKTTTTPADPSSPDPEGRTGYTESVLTARVPNESLDRVMLEVARTGTLLSRSQSSDDVTAQFVDTKSRVQSQTASVQRVRALLTRATSLGQVVQIEGELARREADLESLQAQLKALENQTTLSTLTISLTPTAVAAPPSDQDDNGFLAGLSAGWSALLASLTVLLTVLGALLPFLVVLALVGVPALIWIRRRRTGSAAAIDPTQQQPQPQAAP